MVGPDGAAKRAAALPRADGAVSALAMGADGVVLVVSAPSEGRQVLTAFASDGAVAWKKTVVATPDARFPTPAITALLSDGKGGYFAVGALSAEGGLDLGLGPLTGAGMFVARLDARGAASWERAFPESASLTTDGQGSLVAAYTTYGSDVRAAHAVEIDGDGKVVRVATATVPATCDDREHRSSAFAAAGMSATSLFLVVSCQKMDDGTRPVTPIGRPLVFLGTMSRR